MLATEGSRQIRATGCGRGEEARKQKERVGLGPGSVGSTRTPHTPCPSGPIPAWPSHLLLEALPGPAPRLPLCPGLGLDSLGEAGAPQRPAALLVRTHRILLPA